MQSELHGQAALQEAVCLDSMNRWVPTCSPSPQIAGNWGYQTTFASVYIFCISMSEELNFGVGRRQI